MTPPYHHAACKVLEFISDMTDLREFCNAFAIRVADVIPYLRVEQRSKLLVHAGMVHGSRTRRQVAQRLLDHGADANYAKGIPLREAVRRGWEEHTEFLLENGADACANENTPIYTAAAWGHVAIVERLIRAGAEIDDNHGYALRAASHNGHAAVVQVLLDHGADVHKADDDALAWAIDHGHDDVVEMLINAGADVHAKDDTVLGDAVSCALKGDPSRIRIVELVLARDDFVSETITTAFCDVFHSSGFANLKILVELLLVAGADVRINKDEAICTAVESGNLGMVELLIKYGTNVRINHDKCLTSAVYNGYTHITELLLQQGCRKIDVYIIREALRRDHLDDVKLLLQYGAWRINPSWGTEGDILVVAAEKGFDCIVKALLDVEVRKTYAYLRHNDLYKALQIAAKRGHRNIVKRLLQEEDFDLDNLQGHEMMRQVAKNGHHRILRILLRYEAMNHGLPKNKFCISTKVLEGAIEKGDDEVVRILENHVASVLSKLERSSLDGKLWKNHRFHGVHMKM